MEITYNLKYDGQLMCEPNKLWDAILSGFRKTNDLLSWIPETDHDVFKNKINTAQPFDWNIRLNSEFSTRYFLLSFSPASKSVSVCPLISIPEYQEDLIIEYKSPSIKKTLSSFVHDFNNHLTVLLPNLEAAQMFSSPESKATKYVASAMKGCDSLNKYASLIMAMCRPPKAMMRMFSANETIKMSCAELSEKYPNVSINMNLNSEIRICFYQEYLGELLGIFIKNISENSEKDTADFSYEEFEQPVSYALPHYNLPKGKYVKMLITQQSPAPVAEIQTRMYDPFFSSRSKGKDEGVGLSVAKNMMESSGGTLKLIPASVGCSFQLIFQKG